MLCRLERGPSALSERRVDLIGYLPWYVLIDMQPNRAVQEDMASLIGARFLVGNTVGLKRTSAATR